MKKKQAQRMIPPIAKGTLVGVQNCVGAYPIIRRTAPNYYEVDYKGSVILMHRTRLAYPLRPGRYLLQGAPEQFVEIK